MFAIYKTNERFLLAGKPYYDSPSKKKKIVFYRLINTNTGVGFKSKDGKLQDIENIGASVLYDYTGNAEFSKKEGAHFQLDNINNHSIYVTSMVIDLWLKNEGFEKVMKKE